MNDHDRSKGSGGVGSWFILLILWTAIGYFVYGGFSGAVAMVILWILYGLVTLISLIPFIGVIIQGSVMYFTIEPWVVGLTAIEGSWLTAAMFVASIICGLITTAIMTLYILVARNS